MKKIAKLLTTSALLLTGALVCFAQAADMKTMKSSTERADIKEKLSDSDYKELLGKMTVDEFVAAVKEKLQDKPRADAFLMKIRDNNPELKAKVDEFIKENGNTQLKDLDKSKLKMFFENIVSKAKDKVATVKAKIMDAKTGSY